MLNQLFVNNENDDLDDQSLKCPIKLSSHLITAHLEHSLHIQVVVRDAEQTIFDNFRSHFFDWSIERRELLDKSVKYSHMRSIRVAQMESSSDERWILLQNDEIVNFKTSQLYFQTFDTKFKTGHTKISLKLYLNKSNEFLANYLNAHLVSTVQINPTELTIFNHPSNRIALSLLKGSEHYHAELESAKNLLKINQITDSSIIVSPLARSQSSNLLI